MTGLTGRYRRARTSDLGCFRYEFGLRESFVDLWSASGAGGSARERQQSGIVTAKKVHHETGWKAVDPTGQCVCQGHTTAITR